MKGIGWLERKSFAKQFCFELDPIIEVIASNRHGLRANLEERSIIIIINLEKDVS